MLVKRELLTIPLLTPPKVRTEKNRIDLLVAASVFTLPRCGDVLTVDCFTMKGELCCRFFTDGNGYLNCREWPAEKWRMGKLTQTCGWYYRSHNTEADRKVVEQFLNAGNKTIWRSNIMDMVSSFIDHKNWEKREKLWDNRREMQKTHFAMFPELPENLGAYCAEHIFDHSYIFYDKLTKTGRRYGRCGSCGEKHRLTRQVRQNTEGVCPHCGMRGMLKAVWNVKTLEDKAKICVAHRVAGKLLLRWVNVKRVFFDPEKPCRYDLEDYGYNLYLTDKKGKPTIYCYQCKPIPYFGTDWVRLRNGSQIQDKTWVYTDNLEEVFGKNFYNVDLRAGLAGKRVQLRFSELLNRLKNSQVAEYLFKLGCPVLAGELTENDIAEKTGKLDFARVMGVSKQLLPLYRDKDVTANEHRVIRAWGGWVTPEDLDGYRALGVDHWGVDTSKVLQQMSYRKMVNYFTKQKAVTGKKGNALMREYRDYLDMAKKLGIDLGRKTGRYPANVTQAHDALLDDFNKIQYAGENDTFAKAVAGVYAKLPMTEYASGDYCIRLPQLRTDLMREGKSLSHCVGGDGYCKNHMAGERLIFFIRRIQEPDKPFFTMEVDMERMIILQNHGFGNKNAPKDVQKFANEFLRALKAGASKKGRKTA